MERGADLSRASKMGNTVNGIVSELAENAFLVVGALFPVVNPLGNTPIFLSLTHGLTDEARTRLSQAIAVNGLILMVVSIFIGTHILGFFGLSLPVVEVGGGLLLVSTGWSLLRSPDEDDDGPETKKPCNAVNYMRQAFYPLTLPLTVGPGTIAVAITVGANRTEGEQWQLSTIGGLLLGAAAIAISIYLSYRFAEKASEVLGEAGMNVVLRLSSFILICIGVQITWNGVSALLKSVLVR